MPQSNALLIEQLRLASPDVAWAEQLGEVAAWVDVALWPELAAGLAQSPALAFQSCVDLCGMDYSDWSGSNVPDKRFGVVYHLLSVTHNWRLRIKVLCQDDDWPTMPSMMDIWPSLNWFEREAFDLYGIISTSHPDLRRILTDYGFVGHPFRKDFPISGHLEMRYDPAQGRVIYQPVTIDPREVIPRIVREEHYGG